MPVRVTTRIPHGNAADVLVREATGGVEVAFSPHPMGGVECLWFCFRVTGCGSRRLRVVMRNFDNILYWSGSPRNLRPVARRRGGDWERLGHGTPVGRPDGRTDVAWEVSRPGPALDVAFCYPYGRPELESLLGRARGRLQADVIGVSQGGRPLVRISNGFGVRGSRAPGIYLSARQHAGETPGSWVLEGALEGLAAAGDRAPLVWAVPLADIDSIEEGAYGKDRYPCDLNRAWTAPMMRHEAQVIAQDVNRWRERCRPVLALDFHAQGGASATGLYFIPSDHGKAGLRRTAAGWERRIARHLGARLMPRRHGGGEKLSPSAQAWARTGYLPRWPGILWTDYCMDNGIPATLLEIPYAMAGPLLFRRDTYREVGRRVATVLLKGCAEIDATKGRGMGQFGHPRLKK